MHASLPAGRSDDGACPSRSLTVVFAKNSESPHAASQLPIAEPPSTFPLVDGHLLLSVARSQVQAHRQEAVSRVIPQVPEYICRHMHHVTYYIYISIRQYLYS